MNILVVAAHPDDEILGVGGTVAKSAERNNKVYALILGQGQMSRINANGHESEILASLKEDCRRAAKTVGYEDIFFEDFPDNRFDSVDLLDIAKKIENYVEKLRPSVIYTHHAGDLNIDHELTYRAVLTATRPMAGQPVKEIYAFETVSSTEWNFAYGDKAFSPNVFVPLTEGQLNKKLSAMKEYKTELRDFPHPRSLEMLRANAIHYGGVIGTEYAEAFEAVRIISQ